jgi:NTP pyrophosphatase (non-canonical NTP hydrolase)
MSTSIQPGTIRHLQDYIEKKIKDRGFEDESLHERLILLTEELGELAKACRKISKMNVDPKREIKNTVGEEITDVLNMLFAVGIKLGLDIEKEFIAKEALVDERRYHRSEAQQA